MCVELVCLLVGALSPVGACLIELVCVVCVSMCFVVFKSSKLLKQLQTDIVRWCIIMGQSVRQKDRQDSV